MITNRISVLLLIAGIIQAGSVQFTSQAQHKTILEFEAVELECGIEVAQTTPVKWLFVPVGGDALQAEFISLDINIFYWRELLEIFQRIDNGVKWTNLHFAKPGREQDGTYICQAGTEKQVNTLTVNIEPTIEMIPDESIRVVNLGDTVYITCQAEGKPEPTVTWGRLTPSSRFPDGAEIDANSLIISSVGAYDGGEYECTADNGAGQPDTRSVDIQVQYAPNVTVAEEAIHTGPGDDLSIRCTFLAKPVVEVKWFHNNEEVSNERGERNMAFGEQRDEYEDTFTLRINGVQEQDLGRYECVGINELGQAAGIIELSAHPHSLMIKSSKESRYSDQYTLQWQVVSFPQISQYELVVRELNDTILSEFANHTIDGAATAGERERSAKHLLDGLAANTTYSLRLRAVNPFGTTAWEAFEFTTADEGNSAPPPTTAPPSTLPPPTKRNDYMDGSDVSSASRVVASFLLLTSLLLALL